MIRQHLLEHPDKKVAQVRSVEPHQGGLDALLSTRIRKVAYSKQDQDGESLRFIGVTDDGEVLRVYDFDPPAVRDNFVKLLPEDFRVSADDEGRVVGHEYSRELPVAPAEN